MTAKNPAPRYVALGFLGLALVVWLYLQMKEPPAVFATEPEDVIAGIYGYCWSGDYSATAQFYLAGPATDAELRESICRKITQAGSIKSWEVLDQASAGDVLVLRTKNRLEAEDGRILKWTLIQKGGRWLVTEVV